MLIDKPRKFSSQIDMKRFYIENGYVSMESAIPINLINDLSHEIKSVFLLNHESHLNSYDEAVIFLDNNDKELLYKTHVAATKVMALQKIAAHLSDYVKVLGNSSLPVLNIDSTFLLGIPKDDRLIYDFHQESNYMRNYTSIYNFHFPIFCQSSISNGTMSALKSSHTAGNLDYIKSRSSSNSYTDLVPKDVNSLVKNYPEVHFELNPGDCVIFHQDLIHRSNFNNSQFCRSVGVLRLTQDINGEWINRKPDEL
jgi:hypothetical protein